MHLGRKGQAVLLALAVLTIAGAVLGLVSGHYVSAVVAVLAGAASGVAFLLWGLLHHVGRQVAATEAAVQGLRANLAAVKRETERRVEWQRRMEERHKHMQHQIQDYSGRLEQLAQQVSFPILNGRAPGEPVSTRFADYLDQQEVRSSNRLEALLEQIARDAAERTAFENFVRAHLTASGDGDTRVSQS